jgi:hypothetical protein
VLYPERGVKQYLKPCIYNQSNPDFVSGDGVPFV